MKKITFTLLTILGLSNLAFGQASVTIQAPLYDGSNSSLSTPSGSVDAVYHRSCWLILPSELTGLALTNSVITDFGIDFTQGVNVATTGQFTVSLENTADVTYNKGTAWPACLSGMNIHYQGAFSLPVSNGFTSAIVPLNTSFTYTGGGIYVACEWYAPTAASTQWARSQCNTSVASLTVGGVRGTAPAVGPAPTTLSTTAFRPSFLFRAANTATNEASIVGFQPMGRVTKLDGLGEVISVQVRNNSAITLTNVAVGLVVTGANPFVNSKTITTIPAGSVQSISFDPFTSTVNGLNSMSVSLLPDQDNGNNLGTWSQSVSCSEIAVTPNFAATVYTNSSWAVGNASGGIMAFRYLTGTNASSVVSINAVVPSFTNAANLGNNLTPVVCDAAGAVVAQGLPLVMSATNMDVLTAFNFTAPVALTPNTVYYFGLSTTSNTYAPIGVAASNNLIFGHYRIPAGGGAPVQSSLDYLSLSASLVYSNTTVALTPATTKTNVCRADKWLLTASGANTYQWSTNVTTPTITTNFANVGGAIYSVTGTNTATGCKTNKASITFSVGACLGIDESGSFGSEINVYPNPAVGGKVNITGLEGTNNITVYNILGQSVLTLTTSEENTVVDLHEMPAGNYMVKISNSTNQFKVVKIVTKN